MLVLTYGLPLWYRPVFKGQKWIYKDLGSVQSLAARWITGCFHTTPLGALDILVGLPTDEHTLSLGSKLHFLGSHHTPYWLLALPVSDKCQACSMLSIFSSTLLLMSFKHSLCFCHFPGSPFPFWSCMLLWRSVTLVKVSVIQGASMATEG